MIDDVEQPSPIYEEKPLLSASSAPRRWQTRTLLLTGVFFLVAVVSACAFLIVDAINAQDSPTNASTKNNFALNKDNDYDREDYDETGTESGVADDGSKTLTQGVGISDKLNVIGHEDLTILPAGVDYDPVNTDVENEQELFDINGKENEDELSFSDETSSSFDTDPEQEPNSNLNYTVPNEFNRDPGFFIEPLHCNEHLGSAPCTNHLSSMSVHSDEPFEIECGHCVVVDIDDGSTLDFPNGLLISGKLYFPPTANIVIRTTAVFVAGLLKIDIPAENNQVKFVLYGEEELEYIDSLPGSPCEREGGCPVGAKPVAVVGGQLDIQAYREECPSWEKLEEISYFHVGTPAECPDNIIADADFESSENTKRVWHHWNNTIKVVSPGYQSNTAIEARDRSTWADGMYQNLDMSCLKERQLWKLAAKVKMYDQETGEPISCHNTNLRDCPMLRIHTMRNNPDQSRAHTFHEFYAEKFDWQMGEWNDLSVTFDILPEMLSDTALFRVMIVGGPAGVVLVVDDAELKLIGAINKLHVSAEAAACWKDTTELVITSHTRDWKDRQHVVVDSVDESRKVITLTDGIRKPITAGDSKEYGVEVASLSRPVIFEAESDADDEFIGGHLIVLRTQQKQHIEGVEIRNFGQQGRLGRYSLHFHFCGDSSSSVVRKNVVRHSNQRGFVIHGTNNVTVEENVAFDVFGHCYFLEDRIEEDNTFTRNLGIDIKNMPIDKLLSEKSHRTETDDLASTFWISNPNNFFYGNIAAGGESHGYWFETGPSSGPLSEANLGAFVDNEVHSSSKQAFTVYFPGWLPKEVAMFENLKVYRNQAIGVFLHVTRNLYFSGGLIADNGRVAILNSRGDDVVFNGTVIVGNSGFTDPPSFCTANPHVDIVGMQLDGTKLNENDLIGQVTGTTLMDVEFRNWSATATGCGEGTTVMKMHARQQFIPTFYNPQYFYNVLIDDDAEILNTCYVQDTVGIDNAAIEVVSDDHAAFSPSASPGFLVGPAYSSFLNGCSPINECLDWCPNACLRIVRVLTNSAESDDIEMVVRDGAGDNVVTIHRVIRENDSMNVNFDAYYTVALPAGTFEISFQDIGTGAAIFPDYAIPIFEAAPECSNHLVEDDLVIILPDSAREMCDELVVNGDFASNIDGWQQQYNTIQWNPTIGVGGSGGLQVTNTNNPLYDFATYWLDKSCMRAGDRFEFHAEYKQAATGETTTNRLCQGEGVSICPKAELTSMTLNRETGAYDSTSHGLGSTRLPYDAVGFNVIAGVWTVSDEQAAADKLRFLIHGMGDTTLDNVSIKRLM